MNVKDMELLDWLNKYMRRILKYNGIVEFANTKFKEPNDEIKRLFMMHRLTKEDKKIKYITVNDSSIVSISLVYLF